MATPVYIYPPFQVTIDTGSLATAAKQDQQTALLTTIDGKVLTNTQLRASAVVVDGSGVTQPVSAVNLPLPTGASTSANQTSILTRLSGSLVPAAYDQIDLTYVPSGNGVGEVATAVYKLATVTVKTLTLSYNSDNKLSSVVAS